MKKNHSLLPAIFMLMSCHNPGKAKDKNIMMENKDSTVYSSPFTAIEKGKAPGMKYRLLSEHDGMKEFTLIFAKGDEVLSGVSDFVKQQKVGSARFTAIGALQSVKTAWFDVAKKSYKVNEINKQCELVSLIGDIGLYEGTPAVHAHVSVGFETGEVEGGHLIEAISFPTVELFMTVFPVALDKELDPETDLKLFHPEIDPDSRQNK
jgi:predicted DNA-binding protein with PD1-like motif